MTASKQQPTHIRLPQRAEAVEGREPVPGVQPGPPAAPDPRTESQDPARKAHSKTVPIADQEPKNRKGSPSDSEAA
jgi:hypothetical protein